MIKFTDKQVVFMEFPDEITLAINLSLCPNRCEGCHSPYLREDIGDELTYEKIDKLVSENNGITCIGFMGGDNDPDTILNFSVYIHGKYGLSTGWYSGRDDIFESALVYKTLDYIKVGHYDEKMGSIDKETTNQRMYKLVGGVYVDITHKFWKK